jgi:hypothetical protein
MRAAYTIFLVHPADFVASFSACRQKTVKTKYVPRKALGGPCIYTLNKKSSDKDKGKFHPRTGYEGPEGD